MEFKLKKQLFKSVHLCSIKPHLYVLSNMAVSKQQQKFMFNFWKNAL